MKTAREIAELAKTNRQAVYRAIKRYKIEPVGKTDRGTSLYDDEQVKSIVTFVTPKKRVTKTGKSNSRDAQQIEFYQKQITELSEALKRQQELTLISQRLSADNKHELLSNRQQVQELTTKNAELEAENKQLKASLDEIQNKETQKGWIARLFNL